MVVAHSADVTSAVLERVHCHVRASALRSLAVTVGGVRHALIVDSEVGYFREQALLGAH